MEYCSYRKLILLMTLSSTSVTNIRVNCFSYGATNSRGVMIRWLGSKKINLNRIKNDDQDRTVTVDADIVEETLVPKRKFNLQICANI